MKIDAEKLLSLLPAIYRIRDIERGGPLAGLLTIVAEQIQVLQEDLAQFYDDQFIETCAQWVIPYIGELVGYRQLYGVTDALRSPRAEVANTIGLRRRKGAAAVLEELVRDVAGWDARAAEFFLRLGATQCLHHLRPDLLGTPDLRRVELLENLDGAFDQSAHNVDVRSFTAGGRYNIGQAGVFVWRLHSYSSTSTPAFAVDNRRFLFNSLGANLQLFNRPDTPPPDASSIGRTELPVPITRRQLDTHKTDYYGQEKAILIEGVDIGRIVAANLADLDPAGAAWAHVPPAGTVAVDPVLGRIAFAEAPAAAPRVTFRYAFAADLGGGEYDRRSAIDSALKPVAAVPAPHATIGDGLAAVISGGAVEIMDSGRYAETPTVVAAAGARLELRAADLVRAVLALAGAATLRGGDGSELTLSGLAITGGPLHLVAGSDGKAPRVLRLLHCTLVPGISQHPDGSTAKPGSPSLIVDTPGTSVILDHCITGPLAVVAAADVSVTASIIDAGRPTAVAYSAPDGFGAGAPLQITESTVIGRVHTTSLRSASNCIFLAAANPADPNPWAAPVWSERLQEGCVRFSFLPLESRAPRRFRCQPTNAADASRVTPMFTSLRYGDPGYGQLSRRSAREITAGADDGAEMGVFHDLFAAQRETNASIRLTEFLPVRLNSGLLFAS